MTAPAGLGKNASISSPPALGPASEWPARNVWGSVIPFPQKPLAEFEPETRSPVERARARSGPKKRKRPEAPELHAGPVPGRELVAEDDKRGGRLFLRAKNWELSVSPRQQKCGRCRRQSDVLVRVKDAGAHFSGLVSCGSVHCCPVCAAVLQAKRRDQLQRAETRAHAAGYGYAHITVTARHSAQDDPRRVYEALSAAWSHARSGAPWQRMKERIGFVGTIRATDATVGKNGLHIHFHVALVTDRPLSAAELDELRGFLFARYSAKLAQLGCEAPLEFDPETGKALGIHVTEVPTLGDYLAKLPLAWELTASQTKSAARGSRTMWEVLRDAAEFNRKRDRHLWREWTRTMHGKNSLVWSKGLKALLVPEDYKRDAETVSEATEQGQEVARIPGEVWDVLAHAPGVQAAILNAAGNGARAVARVLDSADLPPVAAARWREFSALQLHQTRQNLGGWLGTVEAAGREEARHAFRHAGAYERVFSGTNLHHFYRRRSLSPGSAAFLLDRVRTYQPEGGRNV